MYKKTMQYQEDAQVYLPEELQIKLKMCKSTVYDFLKHVYEEGKPFRVIKIGKLYRIPKNHLTSGWGDTVRAT
ncbi:DNA-binding protein [Anaerotruncus colihominis]|uniref:DNA-binding protein n=1 Tax=Anaerotruncus colihominis TaxID=169435 RepID=UPI001FAC4A33|nr:DNA-binding protein [Anaerotruncus colihominis]